MCLTIKKNSRKIAKQDIRVYKVINFDETKPNVWSDPIHSENDFGFNARLDETIPEESSLPVHMESDYLMLSEGFFYSFGSMLEAITYLQELRFRSPESEISSYKLCVATIPEGASFYTTKGYYGFDLRFASFSIIVEKPMETPTLTKAMDEDFIYLPTTMSCV